MGKSTAGYSGTPLLQKLGVKPDAYVVVDNKVCAIDETWSGLRLVWRKERR